MTMVTGFCTRTVGMLAWDSRRRRQATNGAVRYELPPVSSFGPHAGGFVAAGGNESTALACVEALSCAGPATVEDHAERVRGALLRHVERLEIWPATGDPYAAQCAILTAGAEGTGLGFVDGRSAAHGGQWWHPCAWGARILLPPGDAGPGQLRCAEEQWAGALGNALEGRASRFDVIRAFARLYADSALLVRSLSGGVRLGAVVRPKGGTWELYQLRAERADVLARAPDALIDGLLNAPARAPEVIAC